MASYKIRSLISKEEIEPIEGLQEEIWGYGSGPESPSPYPARCLFEFAESGGDVAGAYTSTSEMVGFSASWLGHEPSGERRPYLHSQLVGIKEDFRDLGIGRLLKLHQRKFAMAAGLPLVKWTFDPLQSRNAYFNLRKLGGIVRRFIPDYYRNLGGKMNHDFPTDRFWVEWHINSSRVVSRIKQRQPICLPNQFPIVNTVTSDSGWKQITSVDLTRNDSHLLIEIPPNISQMRLNSPERASKWQRATREMFENYLQKYLISDCIKESERVFYVLSRTSLAEILDD